LDVLGVGLYHSIGKGGGKGCSRWHWGREGTNRTPGEGKQEKKRGGGITPFRNPGNTGLRWEVKIIKNDGWRWEKEGSADFIGFATLYASQENCKRVCLAGAGSRTGQPPWGTSGQNLFPNNNGHCEIARRGSGRKRNLFVWESHNWIKKKGAVPKKIEDDQGSNGPRQPTHYS